MAEHVSSPLWSGERCLMVDLVAALNDQRVCLVRAHEVTCGRLEERAALCEVVEVDGAVGLRPLAILVTDGVAGKILGPNFEPLRTREELA